MSDPKRIGRIIYLVQKIWEKHSEFRFMQLMSFLSWDYSRENNDRFKETTYSKWEENDTIIFKKDEVTVDCFHLEDEKFEEFLENYLAELQ